jgi:cyclic-di-GMP phosphodiesterase TipF (flagellum assembly factor)
MSDKKQQKANKKGEGFSFTVKPRRWLEIDLALRVAYGTVLTIGCVLLFLGIAGTHSSPDFMLLIAALLAVCGLILYDMLGRRQWERKSTEYMNRLAAAHDRLVREVARTRSDIGITREGIGRAASSVINSGKHAAPSMTLEARLIGQLAEELAAIGHFSRAYEPNEDVKPNYELPGLEVGRQMQIGHTKKPAQKNSQIAELLHHAVRNDRIAVFAQPIVALPQRKARMVEIYGRVRGQEGEYVPAARYLATARGEKLVPAIDNLLLLRCLELLRVQVHAELLPHTINIASETLNDTGFMGDLVSFLSEHRALAEKLIFEVQHDDLVKVDATLLPVMDGLSRLGVRFSVDGVKSAAPQISLLRSRHIKFLKLDAQWMLREFGGDKGMAQIAALKKQLDAAGIDLIVEKIENEQVLREILDLNIDYGQGYLFGKPDHYGAYNKDFAVAA